MGNYASIFVDYGDNDVSKKSHPSKDDWIIAHASTSGLAVVEVERLWTRFKQMGCTKDGILTQDIFQKPPASTDKFASNILRLFLDDNGVITFQAFVNAMKWSEYASAVDKYRAIFNMINNGKSFPRDHLVKVLRHIYPDNTPDENEAIATEFFEEMDDSNSGVITQTQWVQCCQGFPPGELDIFFTIVPDDINEEAHRTFTAGSQLSAGGDGVSERMLQEVAKKVSNRDWAILANQLHFTAQEIQQFENTYKKDPYKQVYAMLREWTAREGAGATALALKRALQAAQMPDAAALV